MAVCSGCSGLHYAAESFYGYQHEDELASPIRGYLVLSPVVFNMPATATEKAALANPLVANGIMKPQIHPTARGSSNQPVTLVLTRRGRALARRDKWHEFWNQIFEVPVGYMKFERFTSIKPYNPFRYELRGDGGPPKKCFTVTFLARYIPNNAAKFLATYFPREALSVHKVGEFIIHLPLNLAPRFDSANGDVKGSAMICKLKRRGWQVYRFGK